MEEHYSFTEENYLKAIFFISKDNPKGASTTAIAARLDTKASTVTDMIKKLSEKGLLTYKKYQGVTLSKSGGKVAIKTIRKHRLWEVFLVNSLGFKWDEVHIVAEQLEHIQSSKLTDELDAFLKFPKYDPHGDPIPDKEGVFPQRNVQTLNKLEPGVAASIQGVKDSSPSFLQFLESIPISLGGKIKINSIESFDGSMEVQLGESKIRLSAQVAANIYVQAI